jgi:hypothetical protein
MGQFMHNGITYTYDDVMYLCQADSEHLILSKPFNFNDTTIPTGFIWNGASSPGIPLARYIAPKFYKNIKASCVHDWLCSLAQNSEDRAKADKIYYILKKYVEKDDSIKCVLSYWGVRLGAFLGIGRNYK